MQGHEVGNGVLRRRVISYQVKSFARGPAEDRVWRFNIVRLYLPLVHAFDVTGPSGIEWETAFVEVT